MRSRKKIAGVDAPRSQSTAAVTLHAIPKASKAQESLRQAARDRGKRHFGPKVSR